MMAACFSHKAGTATIVHALQQFEMREVGACWFPRPLIEEHQKKNMGADLNYIIRHEKNGNDFYSSK